MSRLAGNEFSGRSSRINEHGRIVTDYDPLLGTHASHHHQVKMPGQPIRPQAGRKTFGLLNGTSLSPKQKRPSSSVNTAPVLPQSSTAAATLPIQCGNARTNVARLAIHDDDHELVKPKLCLCPASSPLTSKPDRRSAFESPPTNGRKDDDLHFSISTRAREHVEIKACLLAHKHHLDVDELHRTRYDHQLALDRAKMQRITACGGVNIGADSPEEKAKRKTIFLLRHFFTLQDSLPSPQDQLLCDIVDDWAIEDEATSDEISRLWTSINAHIKQSYLLRGKLVAKSDPDEVSIVIAMDCLKKLPQRLPEYQRMLDVIIVVIESGLYLNDSHHTAFPDAKRDQDKLVKERKLFYFKAFRALQMRANANLSSTDCAAQQHQWQDQNNGVPSRECVETLFNQVEDEDKNELFGSLLRQNLTILVGLACDEVLRYYLGSGNAESADAFFSLLLQQLKATDVARLLSKISQTHLNELQRFTFDNIGSLFEETPLGKDAESGRSVLALFQRLVDRHPQQIIAILWQSPYLTTHIFQGSENLIVRVLEQNIYRISQVLAQRSDVLLPLLSHTFKENTTVLEEFLVVHPRGLTDILMNCASSIATIVKTKPYILSDILRACRPTLTKILASSPDIIGSVIKNDPQVLPQIAREDSTILAKFFVAVPQCLGDTLEKHPDFFVDIAHRKPALEPLEANPALFTTFLLHHREILPDFNAPDFDPTVFKLRPKKMIEIGVQTSNESSQGRGKYRACEKLRRECGELLESVIMTTQKELTTANTQTTAAKAEDVLSAPQIVDEIARIYAAKMAADEHDDQMNRKRQSLADFVVELYVVELGFKPLAQKKLMNLLLAAKKVGNVPEAMRIKWFERFMNVIPGDQLLPQPAFDFYLLAFQLLIPGEHLSLQLEAAALHSHTVSQSTLTAFVESPLVGRLFDSKKQHQRILELHNVLASNGQKTESVARRSSMTFSPVPQLDDVLNVIMKIWMQHQLRIRNEWAVAFRNTVSEATGIASFDAFSTMVRSKCPGLDNREIMKIYNSCGEENEHGDFILFSEDFAFTMSVIQERHIIHQFASLASTASSA